ncbi:MAG: ribonuclease III [Pseudomonadota bacterium]|nr:ribonuclease III [Pseudomonadota bacterium]
MGQAKGLEKLQRGLRHKFCDPALLAVALRHSSASNTKKGCSSNQRLEFLGDRVLGLVVAEWLLDRHPDESEGEIARRHAALVCREALARVGTELRLGSFISMSRGEAETGGRQNPALIADTMEAVIAALYRDGGIAAAVGFIHTAWAKMIAEAAEPPVDAKSRLQEWAQARGLKLPEYREIDRQGPDHAPEFTVEAAVEGYPIVSGFGPSKQAAEQSAAIAMLTRLVEDKDHD